MSRPAGCRVRGANRHGTDAGFRRGCSVQEVDRGLVARRLLRVARRRGERGYRRGGRELPCDCRGGGRLRGRLDPGPLGRPGREGLERQELLLGEDGGGRLRVYAALAQPGERVGAAARVAYGERQPLLRFDVGRQDGYFVRRRRQGCASQHRRRLLRRRPRRLELEGIARQR